MGSSIPNNDGFNDLENVDDMSEPEPSNDKPFDDEPFDAGVEANEEEDPEKFIQQLSGKLGQSLRKYSENLAEPDFDLEKFAINSVLSATNSREMDQSDQSDIIQKVKSASTGDSSNNDEAESDSQDEKPENNPQDDESEGGDEGGMDLSDIDMEEGHNPNANNNTVFKDSTLGVENNGMEENKYLNLESTKEMSVFVNKITDIVNENFLKRGFLHEEPEVYQKNKPLKQSRRSKHWRIIPEQLPDSNTITEKKNEIQFIEKSEFSENGNLISLTFDVDGVIYDGINFLNSGEFVQGPMDDGDPFIYTYVSDILENGKQYKINVSKFGDPENFMVPKFSDGVIPKIDEV